MESPPGSGWSGKHAVELYVRTYATMLQSSANPSVFGQSVTLTAAVTQTSGGSPVAVGTIAFIEGGTCASPTSTLQAAAVVNGGGQVTFYVEVEDPAAALEKISALGGKTIQEPMDVPNGPTIALFADPEGHVVGLM